MKEGRGATEYHAFTSGVSPNTGVRSKRIAIDGIIIEGHALAQR